VLKIQLVCLLLVIKIAREHEDFLRDNCIADELRTFRLNIPKRTR